MERSARFVEGEGVWRVSGWMWSRGDLPVSVSLLALIMLRRVLGLRHCVRCRRGGVGSCIFDVGQSRNLGNVGTTISVSE